MIRVNTSHVPVAGAEEPIWASGRRHSCDHDRHLARLLPCRASGHCQWKGRDAAIKAFLTGSRSLDLAIPYMAGFVAIGRASPPFPRPKRSMRLSPHCAFRLDPRTHEGQTRGCPRRGAPAGHACHHLLSSLHLFASLFKDFPWRTFTLSAPLQRGLWLRRRLRPPVRTLAFSCPTEAGKAAGEFPSSQALCERVP